MLSAPSASLNYERLGSGEPLLLIHGTGSNLLSWKPVMNRLAEERDVIAIDLPGHGSSPVTPAGTPPTAAGFARVIATFLSEELGIESAHLAGNSMGGWTALEIAKLGPARSVTALCPAGLWRERTPRYCIASFRFSYALARLLGQRGARLATSTAVGRTLLMEQMFGRPWKIPAEEAAEVVGNLVESPGFLAHLEAAAPERFSGGRGIDVPVTVAWGTRDFLLLPWQSRHREELPPHTRFVSLSGCGHVPMHDDPGLVASVVLGVGNADAAPSRFMPPEHTTQRNGKREERPPV
jgi:pimeloyl-ACP methyl ester carboxylesterase